MGHLQTDELSKPDMKAVLSRTHLSRDLHGFLLPVFEAISNAMHSIEAKFQDKSKENGQIYICFQKASSPKEMLISITDNGVGLNEENYRSFKIPFSGYKLEKHGRGFGRFIAFKVFSRINYQTRYKAGNSYSSRTFRFNIEARDELTFFDGTPDFEGSGLCVEYDAPHNEWHELIEKIEQRSVSEYIANHFLPHFLYKWLPTIKIQFDDAEPHNISQHFGAVFEQYASGSFLCDFEGFEEKIDYSLAKIPRSRQFQSHCMLLSAADRIVGAPRDLTNKIGERYFVDDKDQKYIVVAVVRGDAFESRLNDSRTSINISAKVVENIVSIVSDEIQKM